MWENCLKKSSRLQFRNYFVDYCHKFSTNSACLGKSIPFYADLVFTVKLLQLHNYNNCEIVIIQSKATNGRIVLFK